MRQRKHNRTAAFSLIEVVVGIALLGLVTAPVCASLVLSVRLNAHAQALMSARLQTAGVVETLLAEGIDVDATVGEGGPLVWGERQDGGEEQEDYWTRTMDGVLVTVTEVTETVGEGEVPQPYYKVTVSSSVGVEGKEETVVLTTSVRAVPPEGGDEPS